MEKYSQFRDRGSGIAPFLPISPPPPTFLTLPLSVFLLAIRLPPLITLFTLYFTILTHLPLGPTPRKVLHWTFFGISGIWWIDLRIDGVRKGSINHAEHLPGPGDIIASSYASPLDAIYLATVFDPVFTASWPNEKRVMQISLLAATWRALRAPEIKPPSSAIPHLISLAELRKKHPRRPIVVFPECTPSNNRGILPLSRSLLSAPREARVFPVSLKYEKADVTTPVPGWWAGIGFLWALCGEWGHAVRARFAGGVKNETGREMAEAEEENGTAISAEEQWNGNDAGSGFDSGFPINRKKPENGAAETNEISREEQIFLDKIGEALARLGRIKRVGLGVREKAEFVKAYQGRGGKGKKR
ncbi:MAG: hypothetical protein Q9227_004329 [Pyrenula ochraceoflavens]